MDVLVRCLSKTSLFGICGPAKAGGHIRRQSEMGGVFFLVVFLLCCTLSLCLDKN